MVRRWWRLQQTCTSTAPPFLLVLPLSKWHYPIAEHVRALAFRLRSVDAGRTRQAIPRGGAVRPLRSALLKRSPPELPWDGRSIRSSISNFRGQPSFPTYVLRYNVGGVCPPVVFQQFHRLWRRFGPSGPGL